MKKSKRERDKQEREDAMKQLKWHVHAASDHVYAANVELRQIRGFIEQLEAAE